MLNVKLKARIRNTFIRQRTRVTDTVEYITNEKWKWAGHIARMKNNRWTRDLWMDYWKHRVVDKRRRISCKTKTSLEG